MNAQELRAAKKKMELAIRDAVCVAMQEFHASTGLEPYSIDVSMRSDSFIGANQQRHICTGVQASVAL